MRTLLLTLLLGLSIVGFSQAKPVKFQVFANGVNADGSEIMSKEAVESSTHSFYTFAIELSSTDNVTNFHLGLGDSETNAGSIGSWTVPFDVNYNSNGLTMTQRGNVVYITVGHHANSTVYATVKVEYADGSTSANVVYTR